MWDKRAGKVARIVKIRSFCRLVREHLLVAKLDDIIRMYFKESVTGCALQLSGSEFIPEVGPSERSNESSNVVAAGNVMTRTDL